MLINQLKLQDLLTQTINYNFLRNQCLRLIDYFYPSISKSAGVYLLTHTLTGKQYVRYAMNFQD